MFWFRGKESENTREKLIKDLVSAFPSTKKSASDANQLELLFVVHGQQHTMRIHLPQQFPAERPGIISYLLIS